MIILHIAHKKYFLILLLLGDTKRPMDFHLSANFNDRKIWFIIHSVDIYMSVVFTIQIK